MFCAENASQSRRMGFPAVRDASTPLLTAAAAKAWNNPSASINRRNMASETTPQKNGVGGKDLWSRYEELKTIDVCKNDLIEVRFPRVQFCHFRKKPNLTENPRKPF